MAIVHRSADPAIGTTQTGTTSQTVLIPSDVVNLDILALTVANGDATAQPTVTDNSGVGSWTVLSNAAGTAVGCSVWWKRVSNQTAERGATITASGITGSACATVSAYSGCVTSGSPSDATPVPENNAAGANSSAGITTVTNGAFVCLSHAYTDDAPQITADSVTATDPAVLTDRRRIISSGGNDSQVGHHSSEKTTAGASGTINWLGTNDAGASVVFALKPEPAGATALPPIPTETPFKILSRR